MGGEHAGTSGSTADDGADDRTDDRTDDRAESGPDDRRETPDERLDRNWNELLQELRVSQTGVQLIAGFLLTLPFQDRFADLDRLQLGVYLGLVLLASLTTGLTLTPISIHRRLFGMHVKERLVRSGHLLTRGVVASLATLITGICFFIFDVVLGRTTALLVAGGVLAVLVVLLVAVPGAMARAGAETDRADQGA
jgi:hypothetical protein